MKRVISAVFGVALLAAGFAAQAAIQPGVAVDHSLHGYTLPEKITRLKAELANVEHAHTAEANQDLQNKLKEAEGTLRSLQKPGK
jgi:TolA-binding protein